MASFDQQFHSIDNASRIGQLIAGFIVNRLDDAEQAELDAWISERDENMELFGSLIEPSRVAEFVEWQQRRDVEGKLAAVKAKMQFRKRRSWVSYAAAASLLLAVSVGAIYFLSKERKTNVAINHEDVQPADLAPGEGMAILRLGDGKTIALDGVVDTVVDGVQVHDGVIEYAASYESPTMHEVIIPRKGFYKLVLPDGSKVYLNNASSIRYPSAFTESTRTVEVSGESYFEVAKDASKPFIVKAGTSTVTALGTQFAIRNYDNEAMQRVVLTEGSVRVEKGSVSQVLKPSQQATILDGGVNVKVLEDVYPATAWKENVFRFSDAPLEEVMQVLERWYDAKVIYEFHPSVHINATISRNVPLSKVIALLEATKEAHFAIHGETITVRK